MWRPFWRPLREKVEPGKPGIPTPCVLVERSFNMASRTAQGRAASSLKNFPETSMNEPATLLVRQHDGVAWVTLNRPAQRDALDIPTLQSLQRELARLDADASVRAVVLTGAGNAFCAGADLAEWAAAEARGELETYGWTQLAHQ